ncbi:MULTISPECIES: glycosyltransferase [Microbulbifer]|uniref:glycosyltransferase n=1 Tax=Microbulbifer TaxID=48073 RepID=UPI001E2E983F|nr:MULTISPECIES: glycosyltransferase [Microbulbifer]UHQ55285.1 glycosyltransferase [Microbulbifer sp. YPW16]
MRVVQILPDFDGGELARSTLDLAQELMRRGHECIVISSGGELVPRLTMRGGRHFQLPVSKRSLLSLRVVGRLRRLLRDLDADVLHVSGAVPARLAWQAWRRMPAAARPRLVTSAHDESGNGFFTRAQVYGERVIAVSEWLAKSLHERNPRRLAGSPNVIWRGVNTREFDRSAVVSGQWQLRLLNEYPQLEGKNWLLIPAPLAPGNGQQVFLQLLSALGRERGDVFGLVVGDPPVGQEKFARKLEKLALDLGLEDKVLFLGARRDMRELYASSQITYHLAEQPGPHSARVSEALAMNCPVMCYSDDGAAETVQRCFSRGLVERGDFDGLVQKSLSILDRRGELNFAGLSVDETAAQVLQIYEELCQSPTA